MQLFGSSETQDWALSTKPVAQVVLHDLSEHTKLATLLSPDYLASKLSTTQGQDDFNLWITNSTNKKEAFDWQNMSIGVKRMLKQELQQKPKDDDEKKVDKEDGEIEDGELIEEDQEAAKHEDQDVPQRNRNNQQRESVVKMEYSSLAEMEKGKTLKDFMCNAFV